ncbi:hypothetical protein BH10PSE19_BH10PSE19_11070 [soil metagenome]
MVITSARRVVSLLSGVIIFMTALPVHAVIRPAPVPLYGYYKSFLDRSKQTFNGRLVDASFRPRIQTENFSTHCNASGCIAHLPNMHPLPQSPKFIEYHWVNDRWETTGDDLFYCKDGSKVKSILFEFFKPSSDGSFSGERILKISGKGCPGDGPGTYRLPIKLTPI